jgi:hypothetical protein
MNGFGRDWGAPICRISLQVKTPTGESCDRCRKKIRRGDRGLTDFGKIWHVECFVKILEGRWRKNELVRGGTGWQMCKGTAQVKDAEEKAVRAVPQED